jgi:hypothetical protein
MQSCTLLSPTIDYALPQHLEKTCEARVTSLEGEPGKWTCFTVELEGASVVFNSLVFQEPGDFFGRTVLGIANFVNHLPLEADERKRTLRWVGTTQWLVGVVPSVPVDVPGPAQQLVRAATLHLEARVFTGRGLATPAEAFPAS